MELLSISPENPDLSRACEVLAAGGLVIFPTETVYGLACDATNAAAVTKLLRVKQRPAGLAMPILVANRDAAEALVELTSEAEQLYASFLPGPVTVVSRVRATQPVDTRLISEFGTMGIRISSHSVAQALAEAYKKPLTATAAAPAGAAKPRNPEALLAAFSEQQREAIDLLLSVGELPAAEPSTVIDTTQAVQRVIRAGAQLHEVLPTITTNSPEETSAHAGELLASYQESREKPLAFLLTGDLGAGKTQFTKGAATHLGILEPITSPTYALMKEYAIPSGGTLFHLDLWRTPEITLADLGLLERLTARDVLIAEWPAPILAEVVQIAVGLQLEFTTLSEESRQIRHLPLS